MQKEILASHPTSNLRVYVIWFSMVPTDARSRWSWTGGVLDDYRGTHFWDEQKIIGRWYATQDNPEYNDGGIVWDAFYLYGPEAKWDTKPEPLISSGSTVQAEADRLKEQLAPFLK